MHACVHDGNIMTGGFQLNTTSWTENKQPSWLALTVANSLFMSGHYYCDNLDYFENRAWEILSGGGLHPDQYFILLFVSTR